MGIAAGNRSSKKLACECAATSLVRGPITNGKLASQHRAVSWVLKDGGLAIHHIRVGFVLVWKCWCLCAVF